MLHLFRMGRGVAAGFPVKIFAPLASHDVFLVFHLFDTFVCLACHPVFTSEFVCEFVNKLSIDYAFTEFILNLYCE